MRAALLSVRDLRTRRLTVEEFVALPIGHPRHAGPPYQWRRWQNEGETAWRIGSRGYSCGQMYLSEYRPVITA